MAEYIEREALLAKSKPFRLGQGEQWTGGNRPRFISEDDVKNAPAAEVAPVVFCRNCVAHNRCAAERVYLSEGIAEPFCCRGERREDTE